MVLVDVFTVCSCGMLFDGMTSFSKLEVLVVVTLVVLLVKQSLVSVTCGSLITSSHAEH